jgi:glycosyltransferase involved in cell wall biosynthesis
MPASGPVRVSYIISTRNHAKYLSKALVNIREFITPEDELIVMDGASTDNTAEVVKANSDIVTIFRSELDAGEAHGFNKGFLASKGRLIKPLTDDDHLFPEAMRLAISMMDSHPELDAVQCGGEECRFDNSTGEMSRTWYYHLPPERSVTDYQCVRRYVPCGVGLILTRKCLERVGLFDTTFLLVDVEYMSRIILSGAVFRYLDIKLYRHVTYPHSGYFLHPSDDARDEAQILLRHRLWEPLLDRYQSTVGEVLGLNKVSGGDRLTSLILLLEKARRRTHRPFPPVASALRRLRAKPIRNGRVNRTPIEPHWDGSLR